MRRTGTHTLAEKKKGKMRHCGSRSKNAGMKRELRRPMTRQKRTRSVGEVEEESQGEGAVERAPVCTSRSIEPLVAQRRGETGRRGLGTRRRENGKRTRMSGEEGEGDDLPLALPDSGQNEALALGILFCVSLLALPSPVYPRMYK